MKEQSPTDWDKRFKQQARWSANLRHFFFSQPATQQALAAKPLCILEAGCGTGAVISTLHTQLKNQKANIHGVDIHRPFLHFAHHHHGAIQYANGDVYKLPYQDNCFDITICHFLLLWLEEPVEGLAEMRRVTRTGGLVAALAEPDYGGRIDYPEALQEVGRLQAKALLDQGANPNMGRKLGALFHQTGFTNIQTGLMGGQWNARATPPEDDTEWQVLADDLNNQIDEEELKRLKELDTAAWRDGSRVLFVPTFYAWGQIR